MPRIHRLGRASVLAVALTTGTAGIAHAAYIAGQDDNGDVFAIDVDTGAVGSTPLLSNSGVDTSGFSPNALAWDPGSGDFFRSDFDGASGDATLFRNNTSFTTLGGVGAGSQFAGGAIDGVYYGISQSGVFFDVDLGTGDVTTGPALGSSVSDLGDLAVRGDSMFVSAKEGFFEFNVNTGVLLDSGDPTAKYAGLAFSGDRLFGIETDSNAGGGAADTLYEVSLASGASFGVGTEIADLNGSFAFNDAAAVPLPAAAWLFLGGLAGVVGWARRSKSAGATAAA